MMSQFDDADALFRAVAEIFAITVLLDARQRDPELIEFTHACMVHNHALRPGTITTRTQLMSWFRQNTARIQAALSADDAETYKTELLGRIRTEELQKRVLSSIFTISVSDYELHDEETDFIKRALKVWTLPMPSVEDIDAVA